MRIIIDYNGSKVICRVTHYLNENNPHYNDYTELTKVDDDVFMIIITALSMLAEKLKKNLRKPDWMHGTMWKKRNNK